METKQESAWRERFAPGDVVRHFKRNRPGASGTDFLYAYAGLAKHTETGEDLAVYRSLYGDRRLYARPAAMFFGPADREKYPDAGQEMRFEPARPEDLAALAAAEKG